ncbi:MAG TPA: outer membrane protein transport protein [Salinimicrobium sp.]|nr:outer membrane protein transport protein [Salinimicrobium sp.]
MKKYILALLSCIAISSTYAQNVSDALLFSSESLLGTARYTGMSGAFTALGGDLTSMSSNPAGSAVFTHSTGTFTLGLRNRKNDVSYFGVNSMGKESNFDLTQGGAVLVFTNSDEESKWKKFSLGFNYNQTENFSEEFTASGVNTNSIDNYFLNNAQGIPLSLLQTLSNESISDLYSYLGETEGYGAQQALLGYQAFVINAEDNSNPDNTSYISAIAPGTFDQTYNYISTGLNGKFTFNFATQYDEKFYFGANLNSHFINYERFTNLYEENSNTGSETNIVEFQNNLTTLGSGFSFQIGGIAKLTETFRLGLSYQSPVWMTLSEETTQSLGTYSSEFDETVIVSPNVVNIFPSYKISSPAKYTGGIAAVIGKKGLVSIDYSYKDYSLTKFKPENDPAFIEENNLIKQNLKAASSVRIGAEYRIQQFSLRGGYRYEESPYKDESFMGDLSGFSLGLGYSFGSIKFDAAYNLASQDKRHVLNPGLFDSALIKSDDSFYTFSLSFGL